MPENFIRELQLLSPTVSFRFNFLCLFLADTARSLKLFGGDIHPKCRDGFCKQERILQRSTIWIHLFQF
jgi:hypothetical protein